jgi:hypothetical protein
MSAISLLRRSQSELNLFGNEEQALKLSGGYEAVNRALVRSASHLLLGRCREWEKWKSRNRKLEAEAWNGNKKPEVK